MLSTMKAPRISVVMPVHNALPYLDEAIESILAQSFSDFEFVILNDASTDGSTERLWEWALRNPRIRLLEVEQNLGPAQSSQRVASEASAPIVARMDADDIAHPERLETQLQILERDSDAGLVASLYEVIDARGQKIRDADPWRLVRHSVFAPFGHGTIMYRRELFERIGGYRKECEFWEDHDFVTRMCAVAKVLVIPRPLYSFRQSTVSTRVASDQVRVERAVDLMCRSLDLFAAGYDYEEVLQDRNHEGKLDPRVFVTLGFLSLWAGGRPRLFRRMLQRARLSFDLRTVTAIVWTAWASASPSTLRGCMRLLRMTRSLLVPSKLKTEEAVAWAPKTEAARRVSTA